MRYRIVAALAFVAGLLPATGAFAGISSISAHGMTFGATDTIPVFVDSGNSTSIMVKGQFMDLCTGVESTDSSFSASIGRRINGSNSAVEILVDAGSATDAETSTIQIKFVSGQETFKVKAFKVKVQDLALLGKTTPTCKVGETVTLGAIGIGMKSLVVGIAGSMLDVADPRYDLDGRIDSTDTLARFVLKCTAEGTFVVKRTWFKDSRVAGAAGDAMVRGSDTLTVTVSPADPVPTKKLPGS